MYKILVFFPSFGEQFKFVQEMDGIADIIIQETSLFEHFFNPLKSIIKNN